MQFLNKFKAKQKTNEIFPTKKNNIPNSDDNIIYSSLFAAHHSDLGCAHLNVSSPNVLDVILSDLFSSSLKSAWGRLRLLDMNIQLLIAVLGIAACSAAFLSESNSVNETSRIRSVTSTRRSSYPIQQAGSAAMPTFSAAYCLSSRDISFQEDFATVPLVVATPRAGKDVSESGFTVTVVGRSVSKFMVNVCKTTEIGGWDGDLWVDWVAWEASALNDGFDGYEIRGSSTFQVAANPHILFAGGSFTVDYPKPLKAAAHGKPDTVAVIATAHVNADDAQWVGNVGEK